MPRSSLVLFLLAGGTLLAFGAVSDRSLVEQGRQARRMAESEAVENARLTALSVRAALAQIEQGVLSGTTAEGTVVERLAIPPAPSVPEPGAAPYRRRSRAELAQLLQSTKSTPSGLPEAVMARLALGDSGSDVADRLLSGALPVRPEDLPHLAHALGIGSDPRVAALQERLRTAPDSSALPTAPAFRRTRQGDHLEGWTVHGHQRVRYEVPLAAVWTSANLSADVRADPSLGASAPVPDVDGLEVSVPVRATQALRLRALRIALWIAVAASVAGLVAVRRALMAAARANAREKAFLTSVTHELRTPLAAIRLFGETLADGRGHAREYGTLVAEETQRLEGLVERVLAVTRAAESPTFAPLQPAAVLRSAVELMAPRADRRSVTLVCHANGDLPTAHWDAEAVRRALLNLLDNAVKHGREGGHVEATAAMDGDTVRLSVIDDGPGIGPRERKGLFQRFARGLTDAPGTGLGLHLVEQVARAHGGRVDLVSEEGRGCVFSLCLPVHPPAAASLGA